MSKILILMRHADPGAVPPEGDFFRPISEEGKRRQKALVEKLRKYIQRIDVLYTSPLLRCRQTTQIVQQAFPAPITVFEALGVPFSERDVSECIQSLAEGSVTGFVGHGPSLTWIAHSLGVALPNMEVGRSCAAAIELKDRAARLIWYLCHDEPIQH